MLFIYYLFDPEANLAISTPFFPLPFCAPTPFFATDEVTVTWIRYLIMWQQLTLSFNLPPAHMVDGSAARISMQDFFKI